MLLCGLPLLVFDMGYGGDPTPDYGGFLIGWGLLFLLILIGFIYLATHGGEEKSIEVKIT